MIVHDGQLFDLEELEAGISAEELAERARRDLAREIGRRSRVEQGLPVVSEAPWPV